MDQTSSQPPSDDEARDELARLLESPQLASAPRLSRLLSYLVEQTLVGDPGHLKESMVGIAVFDRSAEFDPGNDSIVRVAVRKLRVRLEDYYRGEGRANPLKIEIPKGHYRVIFRSGEDSGSMWSAPARRAMLASSAVVLMVLVWLALDRLVWAPTLPEEPERASVAVLAEAVPGADPRFVRYASIMTEEIRAAFTSPSLFVTADPQPATAASSYVLSVTARAGPTGPRGSLLLRDSEDDRILWTMTLDEGTPTPDEFPRAPLVARIVEELIELQQFRRKFEAEGRDPRAVDAWMAGVTELAEIELWLGGNGWAAVGHLEQAISIEPDWGEPYLRLLVAYVGRLGGTIPAAEASPRAHEAARRATEIAPFTDFMLGFVNLHLDLDYAAAARRFDEAESRVPPPVLQEARFWLSFARGHLGEALRHAQGAVAAQPTPARLNQLGVALLFSERYDDVIRIAERTLREYGTANRLAFALKAYAELYSGDQNAAARTIEEAVRLHGAEVPHLFVGPLALLGRVDEASLLMRRAIARERNGTSSRIDNNSLFYGLYFLGRWDEAFECMHRAIENREIFLFGALRLDPQLAPLRADPRFEEVMAHAARVEAEAGSGGFASLRSSKDPTR